MSCNSTHSTLPKPPSRSFFCSENPAARFCRLGLLALVLAGFLPTPAAARSIGVMLGGENWGTMTSVRERISAARELGVNLFRPWDITLADWPEGKADAEAFAKAGFRLILTVRNNGRSGTPPTPSTPPGDLEAYKARLRDVLETLRPEVVVIETELGSKSYFRGTAEAYGRQLRAAVEVGRECGVKVTNGGFGGKMLTALVHEDYLRRRLPAEADSFARRACTEDQYRQLREPDEPKKLREMIAFGEALLAQYRRAGIDYLNFHWYNDDPEALEETSAFLERHTGLQPMINEIGHSQQNPNGVKALLAKIVELGLPYAVWYSVTRHDATPLQSSSKGWRDDGIAFRAFMRGRGNHGSDSAE